MSTLNWYQINDESSVLSPAILIYPNRIDENIRRMVKIAGTPERLMPHIKTHKLKEVIQLQIDQGITNFKCATLTEAELLAETKCKSILIAYQMVGPAIERFIDLIKAYPDIEIAALVDNQDALQQYDFLAAATSTRLNLYVDIDDGMHRTGISPGPEVIELIRRMNSLDHIEYKGLHIYDGHMHIADPLKRKAQCDADFEAVRELLDTMTEKELKYGKLICGGTPSFPIHATHRERTLSPGTSVLWDHRYSSDYHDMEFLHAAVVFTRVISKPGKNRLCLDLGHKAIASEMPHPRIHFPDFPEFKTVVHSEEHMVIELNEGIEEIQIGQAIYGIPMHICPTMALHDHVYIIENHGVKGKWRVAARGRLQVNH